MFLIANWKLNKSIKESFDWLDIFSSQIANISNTEKIKIIIAPSMVQISDLSKKINENALPISLASQNISKFVNGSYTGETSAFQIKDYAMYSIVGHSERKLFNESLADTIDKIKNSLDAGLKTIVCFSNIKEFETISNSINKDNLLFAFEPISAIGTGKPANIALLDEVKEQTGLQKFIYGGSVDENTIKDFLKLDYIEGFLVGSASLDVNKFFNIYKILCE